MVSSSKGDKIVRSRLKLLITQKELALGRRIMHSEIAAGTGLSLNAITRWMSPEPISRIESDSVVRLCSFLDVSLGELLVIEEVPGNNE